MPIFSGPRMFAAACPPADWVDRVDPEGAVPPELVALLPAETALPPVDSDAGGPLWAGAASPGLGEPGPSVPAGFPSTVATVLPQPVSAAMPTTATSVLIAGPPPQRRRPRGWRRVRRGGSPAAADALIPRRRSSARSAASP